MKRFIISFHFINFYNISFGVNICFNMPNIEIHIPFGFIKIGWANEDRGSIFRYSSYKKTMKNNLSRVSI